MPETTRGDLGDLVLGVQLRHLVQNRRLGQDGTLLNLKVRVQGKGLVDGRILNVLEAVKRSAGSNADNGNGLTGLAAFRNNHLEVAALVLNVELLAGARARL